MNLAPTMSNPIANPELRNLLLQAARRRGMGPDAEDVVQGVLLEALASDERPTSPNELERWLRIVLRNKIVDHYRRARRETAMDDVPEAAFEEPDLDLLKWAMTELPPGHEAPKALEWAVREGAGEKLEQIAETEALPAPRVRQRVVRLRQHFRRRWALYAATLGGLVLLTIGLLARRPEQIARDNDTPEERGRRIRARAFEDCPQLTPDACLERLDDARRLDPAGDTDPAVRSLRDSVNRSKAPPAPILIPTASVPTDLHQPVPLPSSLPTAKTPPRSSAVPKTSPRSTEPMAPLTVRAPRPSKPAGGGSSIE